MSCPIPTTPLSFIQLFLTRELLNYLTEEANSYGLYCRDVCQRTSAKNWLGCSVADISQNLGLAMLMGVQHLPNERMYWSSMPIFGHPIFPQVMTYKQFQELGRHIHAFNKCAVPLANTDKLVLVRPVMEYLQNLCKKLYVCSDRILTCRIKSICSPAKGGTGCYRFNYQPGS